MLQTFAVGGWHGHPDVTSGRVWGPPDDGTARPEQPDEGVLEEFLVGAGQVAVDLVKKTVQICQ